MSRLQALKEEEERRAELEEDEMLYTYTRDDASNQVKKNKRKQSSPLSEAAIAKRVQSRAAAYAATQEIYTGDIVPGRQGKVKSRRSSVGSTTSNNSDTVRATPGSTRQAKGRVEKVEVEVGSVKPPDKKRGEDDNEFKENTEMVVRKQVETKKVSPGKGRTPGSSPNKNAPPVLQPWSNPNLVIRTRRASAKVRESDSDVDVTSVTSNAQRESSPVRHSVVTPSKIKQRERENIFAALSPAKMLGGPEAGASNTVPILEKMAAQLGSINPKTGLPTPTTQIIILRNAQGQTMYTSPAAAAALLRSQSSQFVQNSQASPITTTASTASPQVSTARPHNPTQMLLQGSTLVRNQQGQTLLVPRHLLPSVLQSQGKTLVNAQGQPVTGVSQNPVRIAASPASTQRLGATRLPTAAGTGGLKPAVVAQGLQGLQGKLNPALVQQAVRQATNQPPSTVSSSPGKPTLIQVPGVASGSTITLQPGQLITAQQLQMLQQTGPRGKIATSVPTLAPARQVSPAQIQRPIVAASGQTVVTRTGQAVIQRLPVGTQILQKAQATGQPTLLALQNMPPGTPVSKFIQVQKDLSAVQPLITGSPSATSTPVAAVQQTGKLIGFPGQKSEEESEPIVLSDDEESLGQPKPSTPGSSNSGNIFEKISALSPSRIMALPSTQPSPRKHLGNIFEQLSRPLLTSASSTAKGSQQSTSGISTVISMVRGAGDRKASTSNEPQLVTGNVQNVLHIPEQLHVDIPSPGSIPRNPNDSTETVGYEDSDEDHITIDSDSDDENKIQKKPIHVPEFREQLQQILQLKPQQLLKAKSPEEQTKLVTSEPTLVISQAHGSNVASPPSIRPKVPLSSQQTLLISQPQSTLVIPSNVVKPQQPRAQIILATSSQQSLSTSATQSLVTVKPVTQSGLQYVHIQGQPPTTSSVAPNPQVKILQVLKQKLDQPFVQKQNELGRSPQTTIPGKPSPATSALPTTVVSKESVQPEKQEVTSVEQLLSCEEDLNASVDESSVQYNVQIKEPNTDSLTKDAAEIVESTVDTGQTSEMEKSDITDGSQEATDLVEPPVVTKSSKPSNSTISFAGFQDQFAKFASIDQDTPKVSPGLERKGLAQSAPSTSGTVVITCPPTRTGVTKSQKAAASQLAPSSSTMRSILISPQKEIVIEGGSLSGENVTLMHSEAMPKSVQDQDDEPFIDLSPEEGRVSSKTSQTQVVSKPKQVIQHRLIIRPRIPQVRMVRAPYLQPPALGARMVLRQEAPNVIVSPGSQPRPSAVLPVQSQQLSSPPSVSKGDLPIDDEVIEALMSLKAPTQLTPQSQIVVSPPPGVANLPQQVQSTEQQHSLIQQVLLEPKEPIVINKQRILSPQAPEESQTGAGVPASQKQMSHVGMIENTAPVMESEILASCPLPVESEVANTEDYPKLDREGDIDVYNSEQQDLEMPPDLVQEVVTTNEVISAKEASETIKDDHNLCDGDFPKLKAELCVEAGMDSAMQEDQQGSKSPSDEVTGSQVDENNESLNVQETDGSQFNDQHHKVDDFEGTQQLEDSRKATRRSSRVGSLQKLENDETEPVRSLDQCAVRTRSRSRSQSVHSADSEAEDIVEPPKKFILTATDSGRAMLSADVSDEEEVDKSTKRITRRSVAAVDPSAESQPKTEDLETSKTRGNLRRRSTRKSVEQQDKDVKFTTRGRPRKVDYNVTKEKEEMASEVEEKENEAIPPVTKRGRGRPRKSQTSESPSVEPVAIKQTRASRTSSRAGSVADSSSELEDNLEFQSKRGNKGASVKQEVAVKNSQNRSTRRSVARSEGGTASEAEFGISKRLSNSDAPVIDNTFVNKTDSDSDDEEISFKPRPKQSLEAQSGIVNREVDRSLQPVSPTQQIPNSPTVNERKGIFGQMTATSPTIVPFRKKSWRDEMDLESGHIVPTRDKGQTPYTSPSRTATNKPISSRSPPSLKSRHPSGPRQPRQPSSVRSGRAVTPKTPTSPPVFKAAPVKRGKPSSAGNDKQDAKLGKSRSRASPVPTKRSRNNSNNSKKEESLIAKKSLRGGTAVANSVAGQKGKIASPSQKTKQKANTRGALKDNKRHTRSTSNR